MTFFTLLIIATMLDILDTAEDAPDEWSALETLCFTADTAPDDTDPRMWALNGGR